MECQRGALHEILSRYCGGSTNRKSSWFYKKEMQKFILSTTYMGDKFDFDVFDTEYELGKYIIDCPFLFDTKISDNYEGSIIFVVTDDIVYFDRQRVI